MDKEAVLAARMKIVLSRISGSGDNKENFMKNAEDDVSLPNNLLTLMQVLKLTKTFMDQFSQVVHLFSSLNRIYADRGH